MRDFFEELFSAETDIPWGKKAAYFSMLKVASCGTAYGHAEVRVEMQKEAALPEAGALYLQGIASGLRSAGASDVRQIVRANRTRGKRIGQEAGTFLGGAAGLLSGRKRQALGQAIRALIGAAAGRGVGKVVGEEVDARRISKRLKKLASAKKLREEKPGRSLRNLAILAGGTIAGGVGLPLGAKISRRRNVAEAYSQLKKVPDAKIARKFKALPKSVRGHFKNLDEFRATLAELGVPRVKVVPLAITGALGGMLATTGGLAVAEKIKGRWGKRKQAAVEAGYDTDHPVSDIATAAGVGAASLPLLGWLSRADVVTEAAHRMGRGFGLTPQHFAVAAHWRAPKSLSAMAARELKKWVDKRTPKTNYKRLILAGALSGALGEGAIRLSNKLRVDGAADPETLDKKRFAVGVAAAPVAHAILSHMAKKPLVQEVEKDVSRLGTASIVKQIVRHAPKKYGPIAARLARDREKAIKLLTKLRTPPTFRPRDVLLGSVSGLAALGIPEIKRRIDRAIDKRKHAALVLPTDDQQRFANEAEFFRREAEQAKAALEEQTQQKSEADQQAQEMLSTLQQQAQQAQQVAQQAQQEAQAEREARQMAMQEAEGAKQSILALRAAIHNYRQALMNMAAQDPTQSGPQLAPDRETWA